MLQVVEKTNAKAILDKYFGSLAARGYLNHDVVKRFILWAFLLEFVEKVYYLLDDDDYNKISHLLDCIFFSNNCLLSYEYLKSDIQMEDTSVYTATFYLRKTELDMLRKSQGQELRITEEQ